MTADNRRRAVKKYPGWTEANGLYRDEFPHLPKDWTCLSDDEVREWGKRGIELEQWMVLDAELEPDTSWHASAGRWLTAVFEQVEARVTREDLELDKYVDRVQELPLEELIRRFDPSQPLIEYDDEGSGVDWVNEGF
jgi:hypothetical protein